MNAEEWVADLSKMSERDAMLRVYEDIDELCWEQNWTMIDKILFHALEVEEQKCNIDVVWALLLATGVVKDELNELKTKNRDMFYNKYHDALTKHVGDCGVKDYVEGLK